MSEDDTLVKALDAVTQERDELQKIVDQIKSKTEKCETCGVSPAHTLQRIAELTAQRDHWRKLNFFKRGKKLA